MILPMYLKSPQNIISSPHFLMPHFHIEVLKERIHLVGSQGYCEVNHRPFTLAFILCWNGEVVAHEAALGFNEQIQTVFKCNEMPAINRFSLCQAAVAVDGSYPIHWPSQAKSDQLIYSTLP